MNAKELHKLWRDKFIDIAEPQSKIKHACERVAAETGHIRLTHAEANMIRTWLNSLKEES